MNSVVALPISVSRFGVATKLVRIGDLIEVDGTAGVVCILERG